jgi:anti-sigma-K factor RskA
LRYDNAATRQALAAEYVLGSLRGPARRRFERLMAQRPDWREEVERWSEQLAGFAASVPEAPPAPAVWSRIRDRIEPSRMRSAAPAALRWWRTLAAVASLAAIVLAIALIARGPPAVIAPQVALLKDEQARTGWVLSLAPGRSGRPELRAIVEGAAPIADRAFELWALPGAGAAPVSLGLLPAQGDAVLSVPEQVRPILEQGAALAVSVEPPGGSPTGQPTGPILYQGKLISI